jgi:hypothetical protein
MRLTGETGRPFAQSVGRRLVVMRPYPAHGVRGEVRPGHLPERVTPRTGRAKVAALLLTALTVRCERFQPLLAPGDGVAHALLCGLRPEESTTILRGLHHRSTSPQTKP